jgi:hypothetical protein
MKDAKAKTTAAVRETTAMEATRACSAASGDPP